MSTYKSKAEFITRTREILSKYENGCIYEKTLFLNCCVGLLIVPQQCADHDTNIYVVGKVNYEDWGIDINKISVNNPKTGTASDDIENIAYHIRNSLCHFRFDLLRCNAEHIKTIHIQDEKNGTSSFDLQLSFNDFKKFVMKYASELQTQLEKS